MGTQALSILETQIPALCFGIPATNFLLSLINAFRSFPESYTGSTNSSWQPGSTTCSDLPETWVNNVPLHTRSCSISIIIVWSRVMERWENPTNFGSPRNYWRVFSPRSIEHAFSEVFIMLQEKTGRCLVSKLDIKLPARTPHLLVRLPWNYYLAFLVAFYLCSKFGMLIGGQQTECSRSCLY